MTHEFNGTYKERNLDKIAFPLGGMGAGMICIEGSACISHVSVRNRMAFFNEPYCYAALCVKGRDNIAKVLEGPVPSWKIFGPERTGRGADRSNYGLPRFDSAVFLARFPFAHIDLKDSAIPLKTRLTGWSPFIPGDADASSLPVAALEYTFFNPEKRKIDAVFSYHAKNFMKLDADQHFRHEEGNSIQGISNGFVLRQNGTEEHPEHEGCFAIFTDNGNAVVDHCWFKGGWWDPATITWRNVQQAILMDNPPQEGASPGASLYIPFELEPSEEITIRVLFAWYVPDTEISHGKQYDSPAEGACCPTTCYKPWYAGAFSSINDVVQHWKENCADLRRKTKRFTDTFYNTDIPPEVVEAVAANLTILKSPTVLRQVDGKLWCYEGCNDNSGCCYGSCTHVWNYAQALPHLFPDLERSLRYTEYHESQNDEGHQKFRSNLPIRAVLPAEHKWHAAADGQLGGIMKVHREWRISGDDDWLREMWPYVRKSLDYCIATWDPREKGVLEEPHHNTYDIEYWGPDGHCSSFYLGALSGVVAMGNFLGEDVSRFEMLLKRGAAYYETELFNGEYFYQKVQTSGLGAALDTIDEASSGTGYNETIKTINAQGPKYQYGTGCLSDGVLGFWMARMCGIDTDIVDRSKIQSHLKSVHRYNLKHDLSDHVNTQRPSYAVGHEGGLLLCTWPQGGEPLLPFVYSNEVWTGIEYQVASHLMLEGFVDEGLQIVRTCRKRYDGKVRNPYNEYECGHWYARAMSSYGLIQGLTGVRYDAVTKTLYIDSRMGDHFRSFLSTAKGFGNVGLDHGTPFIEISYGIIEIDCCIVSGRNEKIRFD